jgi:hypothetical protein
VSLEAGKRPPEVKTTSSNPFFPTENLFRIKKSTALALPMQNHAPAQGFLRLCLRLTRQPCSIVNSGIMAAGSKLISLGFALLVNLLRDSQREAIRHSSCWQQARANL